MVVISVQRKPAWVTLIGPTAKLIAGKSTMPFILIGT